MRFLTIAWSHHTLPTCCNGCFFSRLAVSPLCLILMYTKQAASLTLSCTSTLFPFSTLQLVFHLVSYCFLSANCSLFPELTSIFVFFAHLILPFPASISLLLCFTPTSIFTLHLPFCNLGLLTSIVLSFCLSDT